MSTGVRLVLVDDVQRARAVQIALGIRRTQAQLAVAIEILRRDVDVAGALDDQQIGLDVSCRIRGDKWCSAG